MPESELLEDVLRGLTPRAFHTLIRHGVRDLPGFLSLDPLAIPRAPAPVKAELLQAQLAITVRLTEASRPAIDSRPRTPCDPQRVSPEPDSCLRLSGLSPATQVLQVWYVWEGTSAELRRAMARGGIRTVGDALGTRPQSFSKQERVERRCVAEFVALQKQLHAEIEAVRNGAVTVPLDAPRASLQEEPCHGPAPMPIDAVGTLYEETLVLDEEAAADGLCPSLRASLTGHGLRTLADVLRVSPERFRKLRGVTRMEAAKFRVFRDGLCAAFHAMCGRDIPAPMNGEAALSLSPEESRLPNGSRTALVVGVLRSAGRPMHFTEVYEQVRRLVPQAKRCSPRLVHSWLVKAEGALLWDRGTFVHEECVTAPVALIEKVEAWLIDKLRGEVPFVGISGAFEHFETECRGQGVASETALYTCLRRSANARLVYPRYPQVCLSEGFDSRLPAATALEQFVREAGREVSVDEMAEYALHGLYLKEFQLQQCLARLSGVVRTARDGFLDASLLPLNSERLEKLKADIVAMLGKEGHIAAGRVYDERRVTCAVLGIDGPQMLHSLLRELDYEELDVTSYPQIRLATRAEGGAATRGIVAEVVAHIRRKSGPCSFDELESRYVDELGYDERAVRAAAYADGVVRYGRGSVVHLEALSWSGSEQAELERAANSALAESRARGHAHALASDILERSHLPALGNQIPWTQTLVCSLLALEGHFRVLGSAGNAFVAAANPEGIESLDDLVARVLAREYEGAAELDVLEERLRGLGILHRRLTPSMLRGDGPKVVLTAHLATLQELGRDAG